MSSLMSALSLRRTIRMLSALVLFVTAWAIAPLPASSESSSEEWSHQDSGLGFTREELTATSFTDTSTGFAVGTNGAIFSTTDGGTTWSVQHACGTSSPCTETSLDRIKETLTGVSFADGLHGHAVGENGIILATVNGGTTWSVQHACGTSSPCTETSLDRITETFSGVSLPDATHGYIVSMDGSIIATNDAGASWSRVHSAAQPLLDVSSVSAQRGWAVGFGGTILATTNGGDDWSSQTSPFGDEVDLNAVSFVDATHGHAVGETGTIIGTIDGGNTWIPRPYAAVLDFRDVDFADRLHGWAVGDSAEIAATSDGGLTWSFQVGDGLCRCTPFNAVSAPGPTTAFAVGVRGATITTSDGGRTWVTLARLLPPLFGVSFTGGSNCTRLKPICNGHAVGEGGTILATDDGGRRWSEQPSPITGHFQDVYFVDENRGFLLGGGSVFASRDGGQTWENQESLAPNNAVFFVNPQVGFVVGQSQDAITNFLATSDGGMSWSRSTAPVAGNDLAFVSEKTGYVVGNGGGIIKTADGGKTWTRQTSGTAQNLLGVAFIGGTGYTVGDNGTILKTANAGVTWTALTAAGEPWTNADLASVACSAPSRCVAVGSGGTVLITGDGGMSWTQPGVGLQAPDLYDVASIDAAGPKSWAVGFAATILSTTNIIDPGPVEGLSVTLLDATSVRLEWGAPSEDGNEGGGPAPEYEVFASTQPITADVLAGGDVRKVCEGACFSAAPQSVGDRVSYSVTGLTPETTYHFGVRAIDGSGNIGPLRSVAMTLPDVAPGTVADLTATAVSSSEVKIGFSAAGSNGSAPPPAASYIIRQAQAPITPSNFIEAAPLSGGACGDGLCAFGPTDVGEPLGLSVTGLSPNTPYYYALQAVDQRGNVGPLSNVALATTHAGLPGRVTDLIATPLSHSRIRLTFSAPGKNGQDPPPATKYIVKQSLSPLGDPVAFETAASLCGGVCRDFAPAAVGDRLTLDVTSLDPAKTYHYALRALDDGGTPGPISNSARASTLADEIAPGRVKGLKARRLSRNKIKLSFEAAGSDGRNAPAAAVYLVKQSRRPIKDVRSFRKALPLCRRRCLFFPSRVGEKLTLTVSDLKPGKRYHYAVVALDAAGNRGPRSKSVSARTGRGKSAARRGVKS